MRMRKITFAFQFLASITLGVALQSAQAVTLEEVKARGSIRIAVANEIPYGYVDMSGNAKGAGPDIARQLVKALGIENIKWETASFSALIPGLKAGRFDMVAAEMAILPQRCQLVNNIVSSCNVFFRCSLLKLSYSAFVAVKFPTKPGSISN